MPLPMPEMLPDTLAAWRTRGQAAGHSPRTIASRADTIRRLARDGVDPWHAEGPELMEWLATLTDAQGTPVQRSTKATYRAHVRAWFAWMVESGRITEDPAADLPTLRVQRAVPHPLSPAELTRVLAACADSRAHQTRAYVILGAYAGLRAHEIAQVRGEDVREDELKVRGKGDLGSTVPLHPAVRDLAATMPARGWWFPTGGAEGHVHRSSVSTAIKRAFRRAGVDAVPHALRHHFCTQVLKASGGDLRTTQRAARHATPATTAIYTQVADETLTRAVSGIPA